MGSQERTAIERCREFTAHRLQQLLVLSDRDQWNLDGIERRACIYVTGSMAREEAHLGSDLDLFVIDELEPASERGLTYVETGRLIAKLDEIRRDAGFAPFSRGGHFIKTHSLREILNLIGDPQDDAINTFTARILLLINSVPLLNELAYRDAQTAILDRYWMYNQPNSDFRPIMLINDLRRWWGVLCLNFERYNNLHTVSPASFEAARCERRKQNLKLRYARLLSAISPIMRLLHLSQADGKVARKLADKALKETPLARLTAIAEDQNSSLRARQLANQVLDMYDKYLSLVSSPGFDYANDRDWKTVKTDAYGFHDVVVELFAELGSGKDLYKYAVL